MLLVGLSGAEVALSLPSQDSERVALALAGAAFLVEALEEP